jgi:DNA-directed RNA polymerase subunit RPC12/RpoP
MNIHKKGIREQSNHLKTESKLSKEWSEKNTRPINDFYSKSTYTAIWKCLCCKGEYKSKIRDRTIKKKGCPYCSKRKVLKGYNSLIDTRPDLTSEWSIENKRPISDFMENSTYFACWKCTCCKGEYKALVRDRVSKNHCCPYCSNRKALKGFNSLVDMRPDLISEWSIENKRSMSEFLENSTYQALWKCGRCNYDYQAPINKRVSHKNICPKCLDKQFSSELTSTEKQKIKLIAEWSHKNEYSIDFYPWSSNFLAQWKCSKCKGVFDSPIRDRIRNLGNCPYCSQKKILPGYNSLDVSNPELACEWSDDNNQSMTSFMNRSKNLVIWNCSKCGGKYRARICDRISEFENCPYCLNIKVLVGYNSLEDIRPDLISEWSDKNDNKMNEFLESSSHSAIWKCSTCNGEYRLGIRNRLNQRVSCPYCLNVKALPGYNSLEDTNPTLIGEWSRNNRKKINEFLASSSEIAIWKCKNCNGEYALRIHERVSKNQTCPYCLKRKVLKGYNSFADTHPELMNEWDFINNSIIINPYIISGNYRNNVWWICKTNQSHKYLMSPKTRILFHQRKREPCKLCKGLRRKKRHFI